MNKQQLDSVLSCAFTLRFKLLHSLPQSLIRIHIELIHIFFDCRVKGFLCDPPFRHVDTLFSSLL